MYMLHMLVAFVQASRDSQAMAYLALGFLANGSEEDELPASVCFSRLDEELYSDWAPGRLRATPGGRQLFTPAHRHPRRASETGGPARTSGDVRASPLACYAKHGSFRQARPAELPNNTCV